MENFKYLELWLLAILLKGGKFYNFKIVPTDSFNRMENLKSLKIYLDSNR